MKKITIPLTILLVASIAFWVNRYLMVDPLIETREQITKAEAERTGSQSPTTPASGNQEQPTSKSVAQESNQPEAKPATFEPEGTVPRILETLTQATVNRIETQTVPGKEADTPDIRRSLIETSMKHPFVIVEETGRFFGQPEESIESVRAKVATHFMLQVRPGTNLVQLQEKLTALDCSIGEKLVDNNFIVTLKGELSIEKHFVIRQAIEEIEEFVEVVEPDYIVYAIGTPNDTMMINLWGMHNAGQAGGTDDKDIDAPEAWDLQTGSHNVLVGVIDTGIDRTHIDLAANMWTNPSEIPGNGIDDDGNGFIDDVHGWDFYSDDNDPQDGDSHGTHCAGTIGAVGNNANGVVGVCWDVSMVGIRFLGPFGGYTSDAVKSIDYATRIGVDLTSNSWGGGGYSSSVKSAIDEAGLEGIGFVAAAGNDAYDNDVYPSYPASYASENIISVGAHNDNGSSAWFSQWGQTSVDLFAPGTNILSTVPGNQYASYDGTSMATPHVAGAYALLLASNPDWTVLEAKNTLMNATDFEDSLTNKCVTGGRLNIFKALSGESSEENLIIVNPVNIDFGTVSINQSAEFEFILSNPGNTETIVNAVYIDTGSVSLNNLIGKWDLDGNAQDSSGNGHHGQVFNATPTTDRFGHPNQAYAFDGDEDYIEISHSDTLNTMPISISVWFNASENNERGGVVCKYVNASWNGWQISSFANNRITPWYLRGSNHGVIGEYGEEPFETDYPYDYWNHVVTVFDEEGGRIYKNGEFVDSHNWRGEPGQCSTYTSLQIGRYKYWNPETQPHADFTGSIDDVRIYGSSLSEEEVLSLYNNDTGNSSFSVSLETPLTLEPYSSQIGKIKFSSDQEGIHQANLIVESNAQNQPELEIPLTAEVMSTPILEVDQESMHFALLEGQSKTQTLTLSNLGDGELNYQIFITTDESEAPTTSTLWAMGTNDYGQLGDGSYEHRVLPVMIEESEILDIAASHNHTLMLKQGGSLWAMGDNSGGQLGDGTWEGKTTPVMVVDQGVVAIAAGGTWSGHSLFVKEDGSLWVMGDNSSGQLGDGSSTNRNTPVQIEESGVVAVSAGWYNSIYLKEDGSIWAMGVNYFGEDTGDRYLPEKVVESGAVKIYSGCYHAHFLKEDGSLWAMGSNWYGQLGDGTFEDRRSPVEVASGVSEMVAGNTHTLFLKEDGSLWAMGSNSDGELGDGTGESQSTPVMIESAGVVNLGAEEWWSAYVKEDGSLWAMGSNTYGGGNQNRMVPEKLVDGGVSDLALGWGYCLFTKGSQTTIEPIWLSIDQNQGSINPSENNQIQVTADASLLPADFATAYLRIESNDPSEPVQTVTVTANLLQEGEGLIFNPGEVSFDQTYVGQASEMEVTLLNGGTDPLTITNFVFYDSAFSHHLNLPMVMQAGDLVTTTLYFEPDSAGLIESNGLVLTNEEGQTSYQLPVSGSAVFAPSLAFSPGQISESLEMNQEKTVSFTLTNNGGSPLQWSLKGATTPCALGTSNACSTACNHGIGASWYKSGKIFGMEHFAPLTKGGIDRRSGSPISKMGGGPDFHGYSWTDSKDPAGPEYNWEDISTDGELLTELSQSDDGYSEVALPFTMSLYGEQFDRVYVSSNGYLTFGSPSTDHAHFPLPSTMMPGNLVAPLAMDLNPANGGEIYVLKDQEKIIVQYEKVKDFAGLGEYTFQTVLYRNGVIFFNYKEMASALATTGIQNASGDVGLLVAYNNEQIESEMTVRVSTSPKWLHVSQSSGTLSAGQSQTIDLILKAGKIQHGTYESEMELSTNDPDNLMVKVPVALTVEATQILAASPVALDFGEVEVGLSNTLGLTLTNEGNAPVSLSGLTANDAAFSTNFSAGTINPGASKTLSVSFQPSSGMTYDSVCSLLSDAENSPLDVPLSGIGLASPKLRINPESLQITVEAGQQASETAVLDNLEGQAEGTYALREIRSGQAAQALTGFNGNAGQVSEFIPEDPFQAEHLADELIVVFKANVDGFVNQVNQSEGIVQVRPLGIAKTPGTGAQALSGGSIALVRNETDLSLRELAQQLSEDDGVAYVEPNYIVRHTSLPNDPEYGEQWALPKIQAPEAWDMAKGDASVIVAVIDTGIDYNHPDLQGNLWTNPGEIAGNGIDDDGNGFIDDVRGWDFCNQDNDPMDGHSHGTHVAGTIAASTNNGQLVSGVSWHAGLVGLKFLSDDGWGNTADAIDAVAYCAAMDFPISNNSWGGGGYSQALKDVIAQAGEMGHLFCAAAGNSASDNDLSPLYPSSYDLPSILSIAASNDLDQLAWFSCYGNLTVDMAAPGENILSLIPNGGTASYSGTSMATPHVAGAAALLLSIDPDSGYQKLKNLLMNSVDPIPAFEGKMVAAGRLNLANAVIETSPSWLTVAPESGSVAAGGQTNLIFSADAANFNAGIRNAIAVFETNDPLAPTLEVPVELTITGAPRIVVSQTALDFGTVWTGQSASLGLQVSNLGTDALEVSSIASDHVVFSADQTSLSLNPGQSTQLQITAQPEASSEVTATLTLDSNDQENPAVEVALQVNGILPPSLSVAPTSVSLSLEKDETGEKQLTITNTGEATGEWDAYLIETGASTSNKMNLLNALASIEARVEIPDFRSPRLSMLSAAEVATLEEPEPVVRIEANPNSQLEVAVLGAAFDYENEDIANGLVATEAFGGVTMINVSWVTPTLSELSVFDAILVYSIDPYWDAEALGNVVADYALAGGGVVTASHEGNTHSLSGKWVEEALNLYDIENNYLAVEETMGDALIPGHPVLLNVESFAGNSMHVRGNPNANAMVVANWSNGTPLVTVREGLTLVADLSFWPVSDQADDLGYFPGWDSSTDGWQLMANCLTWTTNGSAPDWLSADVLSGSVLGNSESEMTLLFDATDLPVGNYTAEAHFVTNDPVQAYSRVEVLLVVTENQPPVASSTTLSLLEDQSVSFVLSATDPDGDELSYEILSQPAHGILTGDAPDLTYVPGTNFNGEDSLTFRVSDGSLSSESAEVTFIVEAVNDAPWAGSQDLNGTEDEFLFLSFDYGDPDGDAVELIITQYPEHGFIWEQNEMMMYFPDNHYHGEDLILFGVNDGSLSSEEASIRINLEPANDAPVAEDLAFETNENQALVFELQATDVDGDEMSFEIISQPQHGELIHLGGVSWQYLPFDQFSGTDSLTYRASDSLIQGNLATVSIVVLEQNDPPVVQASTFTMQEDGEVAIKLIASDPEGDELTFEVIEAPTNGVLAGDGPSYDYYPNTNFNGEDSFTVRANDGELDSEETLITLIINPENDAPSFAQSTQSTQEGLRETPYRMAILVEDPDNDELTVSLSRDPANGSCYFENEELVYLPQPGFAGVENLMLEVTDGIEVTQATFSVNIMAHDNPVPIAFEGEIDSDLIDMLYQANELLSKTGGRIFELCSDSGGAQVTARMTEEIGEDEAMSMEQWLIDGTALEDVAQFDFVAQEGESGLNWFVAPSLAPVFSADADMDNEGTNITGAPVQENQEELIVEEQPVEETDNESNPTADLEDTPLADEAEVSSPEADADQTQPAPTEASNQESEVVEPEAPIHEVEEAIVLIPVTPISDPSETLIDPTTGTESEATVSYDSGTDAEANAGTEASQPATVAEENAPQPEVIAVEESNPQPLPTEESGFTETVVAMNGEDDTLAYISDAPESEASETFIDPTTGSDSEATVFHDSGTGAQANAGTEASEPAKVAEENAPQPEVIAIEESNPQPLPTEESGFTETVVAMNGEDDTLAYISDAPESEASETLIDPTTGTESEATVSHDSGTDAEANAGTEASEPATVAEENVPQPEVIATKEKANEQNSEAEKVVEVEKVVGAVAPVDKTKGQGPLPTEKAGETEADPEKENTSKTNDTEEGNLDSTTEKSSQPETETKTEATMEEEIELSEAIEEETEAPTADKSKEDSTESEKEETTEEPTLAELSFTEELGDHWLKAPGVGIFYDAGNGWIFQPSMGWCYLKVCDSECSFWLYQEDLGWIWFDIQTQGMVYAMSDWCNGWLHYTAATFSESTFLYDYENEIWMKW